MGLFKWVSDFVSAWQGDGDGNQTANAARYPTLASACAAVGACYAGTCKAAEGASEGEGVEKEEKKEKKEKKEKEKKARRKSATLSLVSSSTSLSLSLSPSPLLSPSLHESKSSAADNPFTCSSYSVGPQSAAVIEPCKARPWLLFIAVRRVPSPPGCQLSSLCLARRIRAVRIAQCRAGRACPPPLLSFLAFVPRCSPPVMTLVPCRLALPARFFAGLAATPMQWPTALARRISSRTPCLCSTLAATDATSTRL